MQPILSENRGTWRLITLNRPDRLNAFNEAMHRALAEALAEAAGDINCRAVLLKGSGRGFCAGQDLSDVAVSDGAPPDLGMTVENFYNPLVRRIRSMNKPVVCAVNGIAAGAGANIALACDIVLAALERSGRPWRIVCASGSLSGLRAAALSGLGITVFPGDLIPTGLAAIPSGHDLPDLGTIEIVLLGPGRTLSGPAAELADAILASGIRV